jgi:neutral ceramidase
MNSRLFGLLLLSFAVSASAADLQAGAAAVNITPPLGTYINGGMRPIIAENVHDELHARALALTDGQTTLAFVVVDNCVIPRKVFDDAKALLTAEVELPPANVMMSSTHSHSCGSVQEAYLTPASESYRAQLPRYLADAVRRAMHNFAPARVAWGSGSLPQHVFCRRWKLKEGAKAPNPFGGNDFVKMNPGIANPELLEPAGPTDPQLSFLAVQYADGRPLALLANYSLHYVGGVGPGDLSADYYGAFADRIQQLLGADRQDPPFVGIMSNGTSGDINNINWRGPDNRLKGAYAQIRHVADDAAQEVQRALAGAQWREKDVTLRVATRELTLATRKPTAEDVEKSKAIVADHPPLALKTLPEIYAREQILLAQYPDTIKMPLTAFRIGDLAIAGWPNEVFAVSGLALKKDSPIKPMFTISLANGWFGYLPTPEQHPLGGYETWRSRTSYLDVGAEPKIREKLLEMLGELAR